MSTTTHAPTLNNVNALANSYDAHHTQEAINKHQNKSWFDDFKLLFSMISDGKFKLQSSTKISVGGALAYVVLPTDVVPDFIPLMGWVDDALVLKLVMDSAKGEISRYRDYLTHAYTGNAEKPIVRSAK